MQSPSSNDYKYPRLKKYKHERRQVREFNRDSACREFPRKLLVTVTIL